MFSIVDALRLAGVDVTGNFNRNVHCPFHGEDINPSMRVYIEENRAYCFTERRGYSPLDVYAALNDITPAEAARRVKSTYGGVSRKSASQSVDKRLADMIEAGLYSEGLIQHAARGDSADKIMAESDKLFAYYWRKK